MEKKVIAGCFKCIPDVEDESRCYAEFPDGLRLIFQDGAYKGFYYFLPDTEGKQKMFPLMPGDHVWINGIFGIGVAEEHEIKSVSCRIGGKTDIWFNAEMVGYMGEARCSFGLNQIGKTVFRSREEAENATEERTSWIAPS